MQGTTFSRRRISAVAVSAVLTEPLEATIPEPGGAGRGPTSWVDLAMPHVTHRMVETNGIRLHMAEQGDGPLVILCHGFPECWYSWRHQIQALANAGFRAVWRNIDRGWELLAPFAGAEVTIPALYMAGERDFVAAAFVSFTAKQSTLVPKLRPSIMLAGCGHWTEQERAPEVCAAMIDFVRSL